MALLVLSAHFIKYEIAMTILLNEKQYSVSDRYHLQVERINAGQTIKLDQDRSIYFVLAMNASLQTSIKASGTFAACISPDGENTVSGDAVVITVPGLQRSQQTVSSIDPTGVGDLSYIDGCSNSILISPPRNGDPCLNYLYFPEGVDQTFHTHPSVRIGIIVHGHGMADYYEQGQLKSVPLQQGDWFVLPRHVRHRFSTSNSPMSIVVFHPDSDDGPVDEHNPMKTRTFLK